MHTGSGGALAPGCPVSPILPLGGGRPKLLKSGAWCVSADACVQYYRNGNNGQTKTVTYPLHLFTNWVTSIVALAQQRLAARSYGRKKAARRRLIQWVRRFTASADRPHFVSRMATRGSGLQCAHRGRPPFPKGRADRRGSGTWRARCRHVRERCTSRSSCRHG